MSLLNETLIEIPGVPLQFIEVGNDGLILASSQKNNSLTIYHFHSSGEMFFSFEEKMNPGESYEVFRGSHYTIFYRFKGDKIPANLISMSFVLPNAVIPVDRLLPFPKMFDNLLKPSKYGPWYEASFNHNGCYDGYWFNKGELPYTSNHRLVYKNNSYDGWMSPLSENVYNIRLNVPGGRVMNLMAGDVGARWQYENCMTSLANNKRQVAAVYGSATHAPSDDMMRLLTFTDQGFIANEKEIATPVPGAAVIPLSVDDKKNLFAAVVTKDGKLVPYYYGMRSNGIAMQWQELTDIISSAHRKYVDPGFCKINPMHSKTHPSGLAALQPAGTNDGKILVISPVRVKNPFIPADLIRISSLITKDGWINTIDNLVIPMPNGKKIVLRKIKSKPQPPHPGSTHLDEDEFERISPGVGQDLFAGLVHMLAGVAPTEKVQHMLEKAASMLFAETEWQANKTGKQ